MRERERLEDFRGGHVACRGCTRLIYFDPQTIDLSPTPMLCCGIAYVPSRHQVDLVIYDRLRPDELAELGAHEMPAPGPVVIPPGDPEEGDDLPYRIPVGDPDEIYEDATVSDADLDGMVATAEQIAARAPERKTALHRRLHGNA